MKPESQRSAAARLSVEFGVTIDRESVRHLQEKGIDLNDLAAVERAFRNMERSPLSKKPNAPALDSSSIPDVPFPNDGPLSQEAIIVEIRKLERGLLKAIDYETSRTIRTQIQGMRDILKVQVEMGVLMPRADATSAGMAAGNASRAAWEKITADLPPMLEGLSALQMQTKLRDYVRARCVELSEYFQS